MIKKIITQENINSVVSMFNLVTNPIFKEKVNKLVDAVKDLANVREIEEDKEV